MTQLSPTAQAIFDAYGEGCNLLLMKRFPPLSCPGVAAAIRALVEQALPEEGVGTWEPAYKLHERTERKRLRREFLAVADELEGNPHYTTED